MKQQTFTDSMHEIYSFRMYFLLISFMFTSKLKISTMKTFNLRFLEGFFCKKYVINTITGITDGYVYG